MIPCCVRNISACASQFILISIARLGGWGTKEPLWVHSLYLFIYHLPHKIDQILLIYLSLDIFLPFVSKFRCCAHTFQGGKKFKSQYRGVQKISKNLNLRGNFINHWTLGQYVSVRVYNSYARRLGHFVFESLFQIILIGALSLSLGSVESWDDGYTFFWIQWGFGSPAS